MSNARERLVREARLVWGADAPRRVDWGAVDRGLFAKLAEEERAEERAEHRALLGAAAPGRGWRAAAVALATVAALVVLGRVRRAGTGEVPRPTVEDAAGTIVAIDGAGAVRVGGHPAAVGTVVHVGDVVETRGAAQATVGLPGRVTYVLEHGSVASVTHATAPLVLALSSGAVEAQVVPVARGEAFAVDVGRTRVAAHGTHLRVARVADRVLVDLNEGVLSVGDAPRIGATVGALVTAPAHAEFVENGAPAALQVSHDPAAVRTPAPIDDGQSPQAAPLGEVLHPSNAATPPVRTPTAPGTPGATGAAASAARAPARSNPVVSAAGSPSAPVARSADPNAEKTIGSAVRACMAEHLHADDVAIAVTTTLLLDVREDGTVRSARFDPPVAQDVNTCAAESIYRTHFSHAGAVSIPVSFKN